MKFAILICLGISSALLIGCGTGATQRSKSPHTNQVATTEEATNPADSIQVAVPEPQNITSEAIQELPKPIVRRSVATPPSPSPSPSTEASVTIDVKADSAPTMVESKGNWIPNEVHLIRGNEIISGLQRDIGRKPTALEMQQRLQTHMGLSAPQADQVIATLGLQ